MRLVADRFLAQGLSVTLLLLLASGLVASLFLKERWLWMDEVCSYVLLSDVSLAHAQRAIVGGIDANPPLFIDVYWLIGHGISLKPLFLRAVSVVLFAGTVAVFYWHMARVLGRPVLLFGVLALVVCLTYLNYTLATQVRSYALLLLLFWLYFYNSFRLAGQPWQPRWLAAQLVLGTALAYTHNFGLLYVAVLTGFFGALGLWSRRADYGWVLGVQAAIVAVWGLGWYRSFRVQALAGQPHSWIELPTWGSGLRTVGELLPTFSAHLEATRYGQILPGLRVAAMLALLLGLSLPSLRRGYAALVREPAALLLVQAAFVALGSLGAALVASFAITSVFLSRYLWPVHLLFAVGILCAVRRWEPVGWRVPGGRGALLAYGLAIPFFVAHQNRKTVHFPSGILPYLSVLNPRYPVFYESANYFMPIWYQHLWPGARFLLDWPAALRAKSLGATVFYHILASLRVSYHVPEIVTMPEFNAQNYPHFYVVDESSIRQMDDFIAAGQLRVVRILPTALPGHQILECEFSEPSAVVPPTTYRRQRAASIPSVTSRAWGSVTTEATSSAKLISTGAPAARGHSQL